MGSDEHSQTGALKPEWLNTKTSPTAHEPVLAPRDAKRSRRWRIWVGIIEITTGLVFGPYTVTNAVTAIGQIRGAEASGVHIPSGWVAGVTAILIGFGLVSVGSLVIGIWSLCTWNRASRAPLIAATAASAGSSILMMIFVSGSPFDPVKIMWVLLNALFIIRTVGVLRLKRVLSL